MVDPHRLKPVPCPSSESCCQNRVMVRNMRRGQIFCLIPVTPCLWTTPGLGALAGKEMLLTRNQQRCQDHEYPKTLQESCFCTAWSQRSVRKRHQTVCTHSSSLLVGKTCSEVYLLYTARVESPGSTSCTVNQGIARLLLLAARQLWSNWLPSGSELMADDSVVTTDVLSPVLLSTGLRCNGSISSAWRFHLPQIWIKTMLLALSWQGKWSLTSSYMEEKLFVVLLCDSTRAQWEDQAVAGTVKHPLHSAGQDGFSTRCSVQNQQAPSLLAPTLPNLSEIFPLQ